MPRETMCDREYENTRRQEIDIITPIENDAKRRHPFRFRVPKKMAKMTEPGSLTPPKRQEQWPNRIEPNRIQIQTTNRIDNDRSREQSRTQGADLDLVTLMTKQSTTSKNISVPSPSSSKKQLGLTSDDHAKCRVSQRCMATVWATARSRGHIASRVKCDPSRVGEVFRTPLVVTLETIVARFNLIELARSARLLAAL